MTNKGIPDKAKKIFMGNKLKPSLKNKGIGLIHKVFLIL